MGSLNEETGYRHQPESEFGPGVALAGHWGRLLLRTHTRTRDLVLRATSLGPPAPGSLSPASAPFPSAFCLAE